jgi:EAL domain-containing protein (putative c-di-GMP-specific phosphodiesterase class I)
MAHRLGLLVVAEGVDQPGVQALLAARGCDRYQGNLLYPAMPFETFARQLAAAPAAAIADV